MPRQTAVPSWECIVLSGERTIGNG